MRNLGVRWGDEKGNCQPGELGNAFQKELGLGGRYPIPGAGILDCCEEHWAKEDFPDAWSCGSWFWALACQSLGRSVAIDAGE